MLPQLHLIDYSIIAVYLLIVIVVCVKVARRHPDMDELFLAGRSLGPAVIGLSLFASNISSTTLIGLPGAAWEHGISVANYEWMAALVLIFTALYVAPVFIGQGLTTIPEILEARFDARLRKYLSATSIFLSVVLDTAGSLYAGTIVIMLFFPDLSLSQTCTTLALFAGIYTAAGGLRAVAYTDVLQAIILLLGSCILFVLVFAEFDYSWSQVVNSLDPGHLSLIRPLDDPALPWLGTLIGLPILGFYYWTMNQYVAQRILGARNVEAAGKGALIAATLKLLPLFLMVLPGAMAASLFIDLDRADSVFPRLIAEFAPPGVAGLMLAGLIAAIMSSIDSALNSSSTLFMVDFVKPAVPGATTRQLAVWGRYCTLLLMVFAALWAPAIDRFPGLFAYLQQSFAYVTPPLVAAFALGFCSRHINASSALGGIVIGHAVSVFGFTGYQLGWHSVHFTIMAGVLFTISILASLVLQRWVFTRPPLERQIAVTAQRHAPAVSLLVKIGSLVLTLVTAAIVFTFW